MPHHKLHAHASRRRSSGSLAPNSVPGGGSNVSELTILKEETLTGDHFLTPAQLEIIYRTNVKTGLTDSIAKELLEHHGPNQLKELQGNSYWKIFRHNLFGWFQCVLWVGAILNFVAYFWTLSQGEQGGHSSKEYLYLGLVITVTVIGTGLFGFYQEAKNKAVMSGFEKMVPPNTVVIRDGVKKVIPNCDVVQGDIVQMIQGEVVPADVRVLTCSNFKTDMSSLTGESKPVSHKTECTNDNPLESKNMAYMGCPVTEGNAKGIVIATGEMTQIGKIAGLVTGLEKDETPIAKEITHFIKLVCGIAFVFGIIFFVMVYLIQKSLLSALQYMLGIILANVPEGLIVTLTVCMTLSAKRLKSKNCLAKTLQAVETLGSTSCICSDKTGTLTENLMSVSHLMSNFTIYDKTDHLHVSDPSYATLCLCASLNLKATFVHDTMHLPVGKRKILGDASESAILRYMEVNRSATATREENPKVAEIPFNSANKYQVTIHDMHHSANEPGYYLIMKGAPEIIMEYCTKVHTDDGEQPLTPHLKRELKANFIKIANMGERVIGYADLKLPLDNYPIGYQFNVEEKNFSLENMNFVGAISMIDPPRREVKSAIIRCREAGIKVIMVTGDHPVTALAISRQIGTITQPTAYDYAFEHHIELADVPMHIKTQFKSAVITGDDLRKMSVNDLKIAQKRYHEITFARTSPQQKLFIVETYQSLKYVVAVTGDGVNDSPALKKADIGIAMGINGTEVSKQAADMILLDDNFASIVVGVQEGRRIFDNLKKTIAYTLTSNTPEMLPFVVYACAGMPLPLTLMLILVVNVGTDLLPAISLAYEESEEDIMAIPPRKPTDRLVNRVLIYMAYFQIGLIQFFAGMYAYYVVFAQDGFFPSTLMFIREQWDKKGALVEDTLGRAWHYSERKTVEKRAQTAYFVAICWTQIADVIICKTRRVSLLKKGMTNHVLNASIVVDLVAALIVTYFPLCHEIFSTEPLSWYDFFLATPFMVLMIGADELRRYIIRTNKSKWIEAETYY